MDSRDTQLNTRIINFMNKGPKEYLRRMHVIQMLERLNLDYNTILSLFGEIDADKSRNITKTEFTAAFESLESRLGPDFADDLFRLLDSNHDEKMSLLEFKRYFDDP
mgnify:CR=1 FL=1